MNFMTLATDPMFWIYAVIFMFIGWLIGWFFTRRGWRKRLSEAEDRIADLQAAQRREQRERDESGEEVAQLQASLKAAQDELAALRAEASGAANQPEMGQAESASEAAEREQGTVDIGALDSEEADLRMQFSLLQEEFDAAKQNAASELERARMEAETSAAARVALEAELAAAREDATAAQQKANALAAQIAEEDTDAKNKEIALSEAYEHASAVQNQLKACQQEIAAARDDVKNMQAEVAALQAKKEELELRVQHSRSDVAGDLAVLTSTMLKIKDDALDEANARIAELTREVERLRG